MAHYKDSSRSIANLLAALDNVSGEGPEWTACCPAHDDKNPSLSIGIGNNSRPLVKCHAGCSQDSVISALKNLGAWPETKKKLMGQSKKKAKLRKGVKIKKPAYFIYRDKNGKELYRITRTANKDFSVSRSNGKGGWLSGLGNTKQVPYRLDEFRKKKFVYIVEGEKDADELWKWGIAATTNPFGAGKWREEFNKYFKNKLVRVIPDNDPPGQEHALSVAENLLPVAQSVRTLKLDVEKKGGDFSDWKAAGGTKKKLRAIAKASPLMSQDDLGKLRTTPQVAKASVFKPKQRIWIFDPWFERGAVSLMVGDFGAGKTLVLYKAIADLTRGRIPGTRDKTIPVTVLLLTEDDIETTVIPRLMAVGADLRRIFIMKPPPIDQDYASGLKIDDSGLGQIGEWIAEYEIDLVIPDPLIEFTPEKTDSNSANQVRTMISKLHRLSQLRGVSITGLVHLNKNMQQQALYRTAGSVQFLAAAQIGIFVGSEPDDRDDRAAALFRSKSRRTDQSLGFKIGTNRVTKVLGKEIYDDWVECAEWTGKSDLTPERMVESPRSTKRDQCKKWLKTLLTGNELRPKKIEKLGKKKGYTWYMICQVADGVGVEKSRRKKIRGGTVWLIPACT